MDPGYRDGKFEEGDRKGKVEVVSGVIALCTGEVLDEDAQKRNPGYYLFWRA